MRTDFRHAAWRRYGAGGVIVAALVVAAVLTSRPVVPVSAERLMMGATVSITVLAESRAAGAAHLTAAFDRLSLLERAMSATLPDSELSRVNARAARAPVEVSERLFRAIGAGVAWHERTGGAFDITVSPLLALWRRSAQANRLPTRAELAAARGLLGADGIELDAGRRSVRFPAEGMRIHLGGLGKGFCADEVAALLRERGVRNAIIRVAGDIYTLGRRRGGLPWRVGVQDPRQPDSPEAMLTVLELSDMAVSTSGNYQRFVTIDGRRYSHIIDPRTGLAADDVPGVTVIGETTLSTDILGTALSVLGVSDGLRLIESLPGVEAMFVGFAEDGALRLTRSSGFSRYEVGGR